MKIVVKDSRWKVAGQESAALAQQINATMTAIVKLQVQAHAADKAGQTGRADGLRSKARDLTQKLDLMYSDYATALHQELPLNPQG